MEQDELKKYLLKIGDLVLDEDKIVTYKFLSRTLDIHVNTAKQLLHTFLLQQQENTPGNVSATYLLAGLLKDGSHVVSIVNGDNLNEAYLKFDVITSEHVYSVQKGKGTLSERNSEMLYIADSELKHSKRLVIKFDGIDVDDISEKSTIKDRQTAESPVKSKASVGTKEQKIEKKSETKTKGSDNVKQSQQKGNKRNSISHFFNNHSQRKKVNVEECVEDKKEESKSLDSKGEGLKDIDEVDLEQMSITEKVVEKKKVKDKRMNKSKTIAKSKSTSSSSNKRKRIISDSEESESDEEKQDALLCAETEVSHNAEERLNRIDDDDDDDIFRHKKKKKKFVDKTILREDGYMETIKEIVYETDSEGESQTKKEIKNPPGKEELPKKSKPQEPIKKKAAASKNTAKKQQTLLSFFKKN